MGRVVLRGRSGELAAILAAMRGAVQAHAGAMIVITGEPGVGKTAVLRAVVEQASRSGSVVGFGKADEIDQIAPGAPLLLALRSQPRPLLDSDAFAGLASLYSRQLWLVDRISVILEDAAARAPVVIAIDDVHWSDPLTRFALRVLPGRLAASSVVWVLTSRLTPAQVVDDTTAAADDVVPVTRVALGELRAADIVALARDRLGAAPSARVRELLRAVGGNPFWAVQVLDGLAWRTAHGVTAEGMHAELIGEVRRRLQALESDTVSLIRLTAVWGRRLPVEDAAPLLDGLPVARVIRGAREGDDNGLLSTSRSGMTFRHDLVREAVYADIARPDRDALHRRCARHLLATCTNAVPAAAHFRVIAAPGDPEAVEALLRAASDSVTLMAEEAADLALEAFALVADSEPSWLVTGQRALAILVRVQRDAAVVSLADQLTAGTNEPDTGARLQVQACRALWAMGACHEIERRVDLVLRGDDVPPAPAAQLRAVRALASTRTESAGSASSAATTALASGRHLGDELAQRMSLMALAESATNEGRQHEVLNRFAQLRAISRSEYLADEIRALQHLDRYEEADALLDKIRQGMQDDVDKLLPSFLYAQIWQDHNLARFDAAEVGARTLLGLAQEIGNFSHEINARMVLAAVYIYRGDVPEARRSLQPAEVREESRDPMRASRLRLMQGWLAAEEGDLEGSLAILRPLLYAATDGMHAWPWSPPWMRAFAGIGLAAGDVRFAQTAAAIAELGAERNPDVATMLGVALQVRGVVDRDVEALGRCVDVLRQAPRPLLLAQALTDHADALHTVGDPAAADIDREANARFDTLGAVPGALTGTGTRATVAAWNHRPGSQARRPTHGPGSLTDTESRVAQLVAAGHSSRSAAAELGVSTNTINTHLRSIFAKLDVRSRVQLSNVLRRPGQ
jgi:DNA-binding CsgD family transcriptional regulator/tetratricopeptide (TPR) repeat protein